jgi:alkylation response protein AidB-like acyl-CoA dehydrogenase
VRIISTADEAHFREEVREWLHANKPRGERPLEGPAMGEFDRAWQRTQYEGGWAGISWPKEYGGRGLSMLEQMVWYEENALAGAPPIGSMFIALSHAGPTLIVQGTEDQKQFHLPRILKGESAWCQGFSEPGAGSDLANLSTRAEIDEAAGELVINGQKIWTSFAEITDYQELLVRTEAGSKRHAGITWVIGDMTAPGITIRPIKAMSGLTHIYEVFYDNVRLPLSNVVGEVNKGWSVAMTTLGFERGTGLLTHQMELTATLNKIIELAGKVEAPGGGRKAIKDEAIAATLAQFQAEVKALRSLTSLAISRGMRDEVPGAEGNIVALFFAELVRRVYAFAITLQGPEGIEKTGKNWPLQYLEGFKYGIGGGTIEIRRNAIAERVLGLPRIKS